MLDLQAALDKIAIIALGNATDPVVKAEVQALKTQVAEATAAIGVNTNNDQVVADEVSKLTTAFNALVDKLSAAPAPVDPAPVDPAPVDPAPVDPAPVDPAPVDPAPVDPAPVDPAPVDPAPVDPAV